MDTILYECGICGMLHRWNWDGDCREDAERYVDEQDYATRTSYLVEHIEVRSWDERTVADTQTPPTLLTRRYRTH